MSTIRIIGKRLTNFALRGIDKLVGGRGAIGRIFSGLIRSTGWRATVRQSAQLRPVIRAIPRRPPTPLYRNPIINRLLGGLRTNFRTTFVAPWLRGRRTGHVSASASAAFAGFALFSQTNTKLDNFLESVRDLFNEHSRLRKSEYYPNTFEGYDVGNFIAQGCNGVIYEARVHEPEKNSRKPLCGREYGMEIANTNIMGNSTASYDEDSQSQTQTQAALRLFERRKLYPLAMKMLFNYDFASNSATILRSMGRELVPISSTELRDLLRWDHPIPISHPNIVDIKTAFVDTMPILPGAERLYPAALPSALHDEGLGRSQTLFLVMKRYAMTLREYILLHQYTYRTARLLFGQLLEALAFLETCKISHRDMKSNNILVEYDMPDEPPFLVLADFGSCLSQGEFLQAYPHNDVDLGGNYALRAPEIVRATPGPFSYIDYCKSDLWAAGTLAYEIFTRINPFYLPPPKGLLNATYKESDLKPLPDAILPAIRRLVSSLLKRDPLERPTASIAANVTALSLFRMKFLHEVLNRLKWTSDSERLFVSSGAGDGYSNQLLNNSGLINGKVEMDKMFLLKITLTDITSLYAAETLLGGVAWRWREDETVIGGKLSKAELQLRATFLQRLQPDSLVDAVQFYLEDD